MTDERVRTGRSDRSKALRCDHRRVHPGGVMETLLPGITAQRVQTRRLTVAVLSVTGGTGPAVLFVHGNVSSSLFWQPTMLALAGQYRAWFARSGRRGAEHAGGCRGPLLGWMPEDQEGRLQAAARRGQARR